VKARLLLAPLLALLLAPPAHAEQALPNLADPTAWTTDGGSVVCAVVIDGITYVGGNFDYVGPATGAGVFVDPATGKASTAGRIAGQSVTASTRDGAGGVYVAGPFLRVDGVRRQLVHIRADGRLDAAFDPPAFATDAMFQAAQLRALLLHGGRLYVAGVFSKAGAAGRASIAALDPADGHLLPYNPGVNATLSDPGTVNALAAGASGSIYVGGTFAIVRGGAFANLVHIDADGVPTDELSASEPDGEVNALAVAGTQLYAGGPFAQVGASPGGHLRRWAIATGLVDTAWKPALDGMVTAIAAPAGSQVFVAGSFTHIDDMGAPQPRAGLGAVSVADADATPWNPAPAGTLSGFPATRVAALHADASTVYAAGDFTFIGGEDHDNLAALDINFGLAKPMAASIGGRVETLSWLGTRLFAGGSFNTAGGVHRRNLAHSSPTARPRPGIPAPTARCRTWPRTARASTSRARRVASRPLHRI
jgi:hypothetical protein